MPVHSFCPITSCSNNPATEIRFPFRLQPQQPENCSYPGFTLGCTDQGFPVLTLPQSGRFLVRSIDYLEQNIHLYDPNACLPGRLLDGFDPSGTPFQAESFYNYTFLSCPKNFTDERYTIIDCLSNSTRSVMATSRSILAHKLANRSCQVIKTLLVPTAFFPQNAEGFTSALKDDVSISWNVPDCKDCELKGGMCQLTMNGSQQIGCLHDPPDAYELAQNSKNLKIFRIVAFCIAVPAILSAIAVGVILCIMDRREDDITGTRAHQIAAIPGPHDGIVGLDQATIDSYTKVVLGESRRVPGLNDGCCPICLSDFKPTETLRCIPDCQHCFHADCIDEWLRLNGTCPLCRSSPSHCLATVNDSTT
ncbi:hypothetical protein KSS87_015124 [Heliosperma pusillum]|nr:hypothetical protein KSS87_015124 [Heliosperma pusillum]